MPKTIKKRRCQDKFLTAVARRYRGIGKVGDPCAYCGIRSTGVDHVPPISFVAKLDEFVWKRENLFTVPCCHQCNSILGDELLFKLEERRSHVKSRLRNLKRQTLSIPDWTLMELNGLSNDMAQVVRAGLLRREELKLRLEYEPPVALEALTRNDPTELYFLERDGSLDYTQTESLMSAPKRQAVEVSPKQLRRVNRNSRLTWVDRSRFSSYSVFDSIDQDYLLQKVETADYKAITLVSEIGFMALNQMKYRSNYSRAKKPPRTVFEFSENPIV